MKFSNFLTFFDENQPKNRQKLEKSIAINTLHQAAQRKILTFLHKKSEKPPFKSRNHEWHSKIIFGKKLGFLRFLTF